MHALKSGTAAAVVATSLLFHGSAAAQPSTDLVVTHEVVSLAGLDLSRDGDVSRLYGRLRAAARRVCAVVAEPRVDFVDEACRRRALDEAVAHVHDAALTAMHQETGGRRRVAD